MPLALLANLVLAWLLTGLIWTIQLVHYPLFARVGQGTLPAYVREHGRRIGPLVGPLMALELAAAAWLAMRPPAGLPVWVAWSGLALVVVVWLLTALVFVPLHRRLVRRPAASDVALLPAANWLRTIAWTVRAVLLAWATAAVR